MKKYNPQILIPVGIFFALILAFTLLQVTGARTVEYGEGSKVSEKHQSYYVFYKLLSRLGYKTRKWYGNIPRFSKNVIVMFDYNENDSELLEEVVEWVKKGNVLFLIGNRTDNDPVLDSPLKTTGEPGEVVVDRAYSEDVDTLFLESASVFEGEHDGRALISCEEGDLLVSASLGDGNVYICPDTQFFRNRDLLNYPHGIFLNNLFKKYYDHKILVYEYKPDIKTAINPIMILFKGKLLFVTLQLLLIGLFFCLWKGKRFGSIVKLNPFARRSLKEHLLAIGYFYQRTGYYKVINTIDAKYFLFQLGRIFRAGRKTTVAGMAQNVSSILRLEVSVVERLLTEQEGVSSEQLLKNRKVRDWIIKSLHKEFLQHKKG